MKLHECHSGGESILARWLSFAVALTALVLIVLFFSSGYSPPGIFGEVLRHNQELRIDASPLFYTEVENMNGLEDGLQRLMKEKKPDEGDTYRMPEP